MKRLAITLAAAASMLALPVADATAWGASGHRTIGVAAMRGLPDDMPAFLRTAAAAADVGELSREPDRWRGGPRTHSRERDTAHFIDMDDEGRVLGAAGPSIDDLPELRSDYNAMVVAAGFDVDDAGWLPYAIIDGYQHLVRDFANWRVLAGWGALIVLFTGAGLVTGCLGLIVTMPLIGHASWHAYRDLVGEGT